MANKRMIYDFETVFEVIMKSQTDMIELVTKWSEMLAPTAKDVTFNLSGRDQPLVVPNIQKIIDTINERTLPERPTFKHVTVIGQGGGAYISNGGIEFAGNEQDKMVGLHYDAFGISGYVWDVSGDAELRRWPVNRYWHVNSTTRPTVHINPNVPTSMTDQMSDFYIFLPVGRSITLMFHQFGASKYKTLENTSGDFQIWHVIVNAANKPRTGGLVVTGRAILMDGI